MRLIPAGDLESANPVLPVRWCLEPKDVAALSEHGIDINSAYVVFVIVDDRGRETRQLAPMVQMMEYLEFYHPGVHQVFATVMDGAALGVKNYVFNKEGEHFYHNDLLTYDKTKFLIDVCCTAQIEVDVPAEHFPKEPPAWLRSIVDGVWPYPSVDQCQFRRRLLFTPVMFAFAAIIVIFTTILRFCGAILTHRRCFDSP